MIKAGIEDGDIIAVDRIAVCVINSKFTLKRLKLIFKENYKYKKVGIILMDISKDESRQLSMFDYENLKHKVLMNVIDKVNKKWVNVLSLVATTLRENGK